MAIDRSSGVLICVHGEAAEIPAVAAALRDRWSIDPVLIDPVRFPTGFGLSLEYRPERAFRFVWDGRRDAQPSIDAIWQGVVVGGELAGGGGPDGLDESTRRTCAAAAEMAVLGMLDSMEAFQLDPYWSAARAGNKPYQLRIAPAFGLEVPETIVSNDPHEVRAFARRCAGHGLVTKMLVQPAVSGAGGDDGTQVVFTSPVSEADLAELDGLRLCPMIFQRRVDTELDVRVTVVGRRVFGAALARAGESVDWRRDRAVRGERAEWAPCELPPEVAGGAVRMLDHLGLNHGAFDFIRTPAGRFVFLELNPYGSFSFLGPTCADPIAAAIADVLADPAARRAAAPGRAAP